MPYVATAVNTASSFVISEVDDSGKPVSGGFTITLMNRALPYRPVHYTGKLRLSVTWYPGNPIATPQVLGPEEGPSTFTGYWKDRFLADGAVEGEALINGVEILDSMSLVETVDLLRRRGSLLRVTWDRVNRRGFLTEFEFKPHRHEDIEWSMTFTWISQDDPTIPPGGVPPDLQGIKAGLTATFNALSSAVADASDAFQTALTIPEVKADAAAIQNLANTVAFSVQQQADAVNSDIEAISANIDNVADNVNSLVEASLSVASAATRTAALLGNIQQQGQDIQDTCESLVDSQFYAPLAQFGVTLSSTGTPEPSFVLGAGGLLAEVQSISSMTCGQAVKASLALRGIKDSARDQRYDAASAQQSLATQTTQLPLLAAFIARAGQDLRLVSTQFYGTPDEWRSLMIFNGFTSSLLAAGQVVYVPTQPVQPGAA